MSDQEDREVRGELLPGGMSEAELLGGPSNQGTSSVPMTAPNGASFTFWAHSPGLPHSLYLIYQQGREAEVVEWAAGFASVVENSIAAQRYIRERSIRKAAERGSRPTELPAHRPRRAPQPGSFIPPRASPQQAAPQQPQAQQAQQVHHRPHPSAPAASQQALDHEAEVARARVRAKQQLADATQLFERFAASPEGAAHMRRILDEADARRVALHPPGSAGAMAAAAAGQPQAPAPSPTPNPPPAAAAPNGSA